MGSLGVEYRRSGTKKNHNDGFITGSVSFRLRRSRGTGKPGEVWGSGGWKSRSRIQGGGRWPLVGVRGQSPPKSGSGGEAPCWTGFNDYKDILSAILLIKSCIYSIIRSLTSVLIFSRQLLK